MSKAVLPEPALPDPGLSEPARLLVAAVEAVRAQVATDLPGPQALDELRVLIGQLDTLRAVTLARIADVDTRGLHTLDAAPTTSSWIERQHTGLGRDDVALARKLPRMPQVAEHVATGSLSLSAAALVGQALDKVRRHVDRLDGRIGQHDGEKVLANVIVEGVLDQLAEARGGYDDDDPELVRLIDELVEIWQRPLGQLDRLESAFVLLARRIERSLLAQALDRLVDAVVPERLETDAERAHHARGLTVVLKSDGSGYTVRRGDLDLECGSLLVAVLTAAKATDPLNVADTAAWAVQRQQDQVDPQGPAREPATGTATGPVAPREDAGEPDADQIPAALLDEPTAPAPRSRAQQDHDALSRGLRALLDSGALGTRGKQAPHLLFTVPDGALTREPGALSARTSDGTRLPAGLVRRLLCDSRLTRVVLSLGRRVLEVSHSERTLKAHERTALHVQWGGRCAGAGCTSPPGSLVPHHATPWHLTGTTALAESFPLCATTHHDVHEGGKTITLRDGRRLGPDGWAPGPDG